MTSMISTGMSASICIRPDPARIAPKSSAASMIPTGCARPRSATVIASKPIDVPYEAVMNPLTPRIWMPPARPASSPHSDIVRIVMNAGRMPA